VRDQTDLWIASTQRKHRIRQIKFVSLAVLIVVVRPIVIDGTSVSPKLVKLNTKQNEDSEKLKKNRSNAL
jgi:hypothetical protein